MVEQALYEGLSLLFGRTSGTMPEELSKNVDFRLRARVAARAARDTVIRKGVLEGMTLPGKLADCSENDAGRDPNFILLRVILPAARPSRAATGNFRQFCLCAEKF